ncbi:MAG: cytochrome C oxidase subunit IV family protein [Chloroflexi bacterium]|nr:cytochrome C oxidase subunit IV family protein [Chloroflexota bacterium]
MTQTPETHAAKPNYLRIFVFLAVLTAVEVFAAFSIATPWLRVSFLLLLALSKAGLVAAYYMHLRFDKIAFRVIAFGPLVLVALLTTVLFLERNLGR